MVSLEASKAKEERNLFSGPGMGTVVSVTL